MGKLDMHCWGFLKAASRRETLSSPTCLKGEGGGGGALTRPNEMSSANADETTTFFSKREKEEINQR